jgi:fibronectin type 3 domain-containing protein
MRGYVHPSSSGDYTFWIAGDDNCELWLSTDDNPANASMIANVPGWTSSREWTKYGEQQSAVISLTGGQKYYIEALQKEGGGGDNLAVAWQGGGFSQEVIDGSYLSPWIGGGDTTPPAAPTALTATAGDAQVSLDWADNTEPDLAGYDVYRSTTTGGPYSVIDFDLTQSDYTDNSVSNGTTYYYVVTAVDTSNNESEYSSQVSATPSPSQAPYGGTAWNIPGKIEAENYDTGGESVAYHDVDAGNAGGQYRTDDVDIKVTADTDGGYAVGWFNAGEWLEYTVNVPATGTYDIQSRVGSALEGRTFWVEFNGVNKTGNINVPQMADWDQYQTVTIPGVSLSAGQQVMRVEMGLLDFMDLNWINIVETADTTPPAAPAGLAATAGDATVWLDWSDNGEADLDGYNVYRSTTSGGGYSQINGSLLSSSDYTDNSVSNGTTYYYVVTAVDTSSNESGYSGEVSATPQGAPPTAMHVADIAMSTKKAGKNVNGIATVTVVDTGGAPVEGATVYGHWSGLTSDSDSGVTAADGTVSLSSNKLKNPIGTFTFTVDNITKVGWTYDFAANVETSDSITVP